MRTDLLQDPTLSQGVAETPAAPLLAPVVSPPLAFEDAIGVDLILEGFLAHHAHPREIALTGTADLVLAGDYCYAAGLVRVARANDLFVIDVLAQLVALSSGVVASGRRAQLPTIWLGALAAIAHHDRALATDQFRDAVLHAVGSDDIAGFAALAATLSDPPNLEEVFA